MFSVSTETDVQELDPVLAGLVKRLPDADSVWPDSDRKVWLATIEQAFKVVYRDNEGTSSK